MSTTVKASFEVTDWNEHALDDHDDAHKVSAARVTKKYSGAIAGESVTEWVMAYADEENASFVGLERIVGTFDGKHGTLVVQHQGTYEDGAATADLSVVPKCGTDELAGVTGAGAFRADPAGTVTLDLTFPPVAGLGDGRGRRV